MSNHSNQKSYMTIHIEALTFSAIIGILDFERTTPQEVVVDLTIDYHYNEENFINYAEVIKLIENNIIENKYQLLENALTDLEEKILFTYPQIEEFNLKITKPTIISNAKVALSIKGKSNKHNSIAKNKQK